MSCSKANGQLCDYPPPGACRAVCVCAGRPDGLKRLIMQAFGSEFSFIITEQVPANYKHMYVPLWLLRGG